LANFGANASTKAHDIAEIFHQGRLVATFGIRRGSNKNLGHDHIPHQIFLRAREAKLLGQCPMSKEQWLQIITGKGMA
jgi:hypothetical protein